MRGEQTPVNVVQFVAKCNIIIDIGFFELLSNMVAEIDSCDPAFLNILEPFLVVSIIREMVIEYIFPDQDELIDAVAQHMLDDITFEVHDIIVYRIIPFADHFDDTVTQVVVSKKDLDIQGRRANFIPLGMYIIIVNAIAELELAVFPAVKRGPFIFRGNVFMPPGVKGLDGVHVTYA